MRFCSNNFLFAQSQHEPQNRTQESFQLYFFQQNLFPVKSICCYQINFANLFQFLNNMIVELNKSHQFSIHQTNLFISLKIYVNVWTSGYLICILFSNLSSTFLWTKSTSGPLATGIDKCFNPSSFICNNFCMLQPISSKKHLYLHYQNYRIIYHYQFQICLLS